MSALPLKDNGDLHVLELASIPNKCMQCCLFLKELTLRCVLCVGFPSALRHAQKNYIRGLCNTLPRCSHLMKILKNENGIFFCVCVKCACHQAARPVPSWTWRHYFQLKLSFQVTPSFLLMAKAWACAASRGGKCALTPRPWWEKCREAGCRCICWSCANSHFLL